MIIVYRWNKSGTTLLVESGWNKTIVYGASKITDVDSMTIEEFEREVKRQEESIIRYLKTASEMSYPVQYYTQRQYDFFIDYVIKNDVVLTKDQINAMLSS